MSRKWWLSSFLVVAGWSCFIPTAGAQDTLLGELYGRGVHSYFSHDYKGAYDALSEAIASGSKDPRVFYFRGLAESRLGRPDEAAEDFRLGAQHEVAGGSIVNVGKALERVQGAERLELEAQRRKARLTVHNEAQNRAQRRYDQRQADESKVLRDPTKKPVAPAALPTKPDANDPFKEAPPAPPAPAPAEDTEPMDAAVTPAKPVPAAPVKPVAPPKPAEDDPFGAPAPAEAPAEKPAEEPAAEEEKPADEKPAAEEKPAGDDPFGGEEKPAEEMPAEEKAATEDEKPAEEMPADEKPAEEPAAEEEKPAAEEKPAEDAADEKKPTDEKPAEDDPFSSVTPQEKPVVAKAALTGKGSIWGSLTRAAQRSIPKVPGNLPNVGPVAGPRVAPPVVEEEAAGPKPVAAQPLPDNQVDPFADDDSEVKPASAEAPVEAEKPAAKPEVKKEDEEAFDPFGDSK